MEALLDEYLRLRKSYVGLPLSSYINFDTELVSAVITKLRREPATRPRTLLD